MFNNNNFELNYDERKDITSIIFKILSNENYFDVVEKSMPDMITCKFKHSKIQPKSSKFADTPILDCSFVIYSNKIIFAVSYLVGKNCKDIVRRINSELPFKTKLIDAYSNDTTLPINIEFMSSEQLKDLYCLDTSKKYEFLKKYIESFFKNYVEVISDKILEIALNVVISDKK